MKSKAKMPGFSGVRSYQGQVAPVLRHQCSGTRECEFERHENKDNASAGGLGQVALPLRALVSSLDGRGQMREKSGEHESSNSATLCVVVGI